MVHVEGLYYTLSTRVSVPSSELAHHALSPASECVPPWDQRGGNKGGEAGGGGGGANSDDWRESLHGTLVLTHK